MDITILSVGKIKEKYLTDGIAEYQKRLSRYCRVRFESVEDEKTPDKAPEAINAKIKKTEGQRLLDRLKKDDTVIALAIDGQKLSSEGLAKKIDALMTGGSSRLTFVIGGSLGLSDEVLSRADIRLSFSDMTFPHQLMQLILLEQIYRSFKIIHGEPYHK